MSKSYAESSLASAVGPIISEHGEWTLNGLNSICKIVLRYDGIT